MAMGTTVDALIERVRRDALIANRGPVYTLATPGYTSGTTTIILNETPSHIGMGSIVAMDYELFYVQSVAPSTKTLTVIPGYMGTTPANHATNALVEIDPRSPKAMLADYCEQEILSWERELWRTTAVEISIEARERTYDLGIAAGQDVYFILAARSEPHGDLSNFWNFSWTGDAWPSVSVKLLRNMNVANFASGYAVQLTGYPNKTTTLRLAIAQPFDLSPFTSTTDFVADVGLKRQWLEIVEWGCRYKALQALLAGRVDWRHGTMSREADEVSPLDLLRASSSAEEKRNLRFTKAAVDLRGEFAFREW